MFNQLAERFESIFRDLRGLGKITDSNIQQASREIRRVLLEADVNIVVAKDFVNRVKDRAQGTKVLRSVKPGEHFKDSRIRPSVNHLLTDKALCITALATQGLLPIIEDRARYVG